MDGLKAHVEAAKESLYFSGAKIDQHLDGFLSSRSGACLTLGKEAKESLRHLYLVGSGGSFASMQTAKYAVEALLSVGADAVTSYELIWRRPRQLAEGAIAILASYSGETEDTVAALRYAKECGARTVAVVGKPESTMAREADVVLPYDSGAIFEVPIVTVILFVRGLLSDGDREAEAQELVDGIGALPDALRRSLADAEGRAESRARELLSAQHLYVLGAGPNAPLAYKLAMSVVMENVRIGATYSDAVEWRHGPAEAMERLRGRFLVLLGTDESRGLTERTIDFCRTQGSDVTVYDAAELGDVHPLLTPLVLNSHTQWLIVYSAILRGITDLDERVFMGHNVLADGGAGWP